MLVRSFLDRIKSKGRSRSSLTAKVSLGLLIVLASFTMQRVSAQTVTTGQLTGLITDPAGAAVNTAAVTLKSASTGETQQATSNGSGEFRFSLLRPGSYSLTVKAAGFQETSRTATVALGQSQSLAIQLGVQTQSTVVEVNSATPLLQNDNANLATSFDTHQLENLPAPGNDMTAYAFNAPGVTISTGGGYGSFSAFGLPATANLFTINGSDNMDPYLNLNNSGASNLTLGSNELSDAVVVLNGYTGQYGRQAGANVNYVTKSGTNTFHGNAGWQYNERVMNANDWFNNATGTARPFAISNEWAASIGGPVIIPKLIDGRNKLFFFVDNEGLRYVLPGGGPVYVPTQQFSTFVLNNLRATNSAAVPFYTTALNLYGTSSGAARATPLNAAQDSALGCGDFSGGGFGAGGSPCASTFRSTVNNLNTEWLMAARVDYDLSSKDQVYFRYNTDHGVQATGTDPINAAFNANSVQPSYGGQFGYTRTFSPTITNQLLLSGSYYTATFGPPDLAASLAVFPTTFAFTDGAPYNNLGGTNQSYPSGRKVRQWQLVDDFSVSRGSHTLKFGANVRKNFISTYAYGAGTSGLFTFNSMTDFVNGSLGNGSTYSQSFANIGAEGLTLYSAGFYAQDEWKVRPNLTLTLALRMDRNSNIKCATGCFNELASQPFGQLTHDASVPYNAAIKTGLTQAFPNVEPVVPAPRVGFAWNPSKDTVVRGGFGIFSDLYQGLIADRLITNTPGVASLTTNSGLVALNTTGSAFSNVQNSFVALNQGFAQGATVGQLSSAVPGFTRPNINTVSNELYNPKYYEWNVEVQQVFGRSLISLNYVGNRGYQELNQNLLANAYSVNNFQGLPTSAPDPRFGEIRQLSNTGVSNYNGLVAGYKWRIGSSFNGSVNYTWSHALDTCSNECLEPFNALSAASYRYQLSPASTRAQNYGNADYDVRHSLNANYVYTVPTSQFHNGFLKAVAGGWTVAGTFFFHSGYPFTIVNTSIRGTQLIRNASGIATQPIIADYLGTGGVVPCTTPNVPCYSVSSFASAANQLNFGNLSRNSWRGPGYFDTDMNVNKTFTFHERAKLLVGAYFFNILNHPNFDLPTNNLASSNFGQILNTVSAPTSAYGSFQGSAVSGRVIQTQVKLSF